MSAREKRLLPATQVPTNASAFVGAHGMLKRLNVFASTKRGRECSNCRDEGTIVFDPHSGDELCSNCGMVLETRVMSEEQEWRSFANSDEGGNDRSRVGGPNDSWLSDGVQGTSMMTADKSYQRLMMVHEMATAATGGDRQLKSAFQNLRNIAEAFNVKESIVERCKEIVKDLQTANNLKSRTGIVYMLAVLYLACRDEGVTRSLKDLVTYDRSVSTKELGKAINRLKKLLPSRNRYQPVSVTAAELMPRLCLRLQLSQQLTSVAEYISRRAETFVSKAYRPNSIAAAAIYLVCQLCNVRVDVGDIAATAKTSVSTVVSVYKEMLPMKQYLLPASFVITNPNFQ